jgi:NAD(P)-dependent dehydrogenase (short-subunit alcohol dehydrogenase family)
MSKTDLGVALVTGASTGIGRATAKALQKAGFRVFGTSRRAVAERSDDVTMLTCDVTDDASVAKLVDEVLTKAARIDLLPRRLLFGHRSAP